MGFSLQSFEGVLAEEKETVLNQQLGTLRELDALWLHFEVRQECNHIFRIQNSSTRIRQVTISRGGEKDLIRASDFHTFLGYERVTAYEETDSGFIWTQTIYKGNVIGISLISDGVSKMIFGRSGEPKKQISHSDVFSHPTDFSVPIPSTVESRKESTSSRARLEESSEISQLSMKPNSSSESLNAGLGDSESSETIYKNHYANDDEIQKLMRIQKKHWETRAKKTDIDRIAFFQFDVDDSYTHPLTEVCCKRRNGVKDGKISDFKKEPHTYVEKMNLQAARNCADGNY